MTLNTRDFGCLGFSGVLRSSCRARAVKSVSGWREVRFHSVCRSRGWRSVPRAAGPGLAGRVPHLLPGTGAGGQWIPGAKTVICMYHILPGDSVIDMYGFLSKAYGQSGHLPSVSAIHTSVKSPLIMRLSCGHPQAALGARIFWVRAAASPAMVHGQDLDESRSAGQERVASMARDV